MKHYLFYVLFLSGIAVNGNNIKVANTIITGKNTTAGANNAANHILVQFDLSWENSWRMDPAIAPNNWDAAWVFVKYRVGTGAWTHAFLHNTGHTAPTGCTIDAGLLTPGTAFNSVTNPALGVFVYRNSIGTGNNLFENIQLRWNYRANGVDDNAEIQVQVFAVEMVYVPQGAFTVGDGSGNLGYVRTRISSANTGNGVGFPSASNPTNELQQGNLNLTGYPNGFNAYYAMKYHITQLQYVEFLNTLTREQQDSRTATSLTAASTNITNRFVLSNTATVANRCGVSCASTVLANTPINFFCDLNENGTPNEANDGQNIACNFLSYLDVFSYLDWAGLRPMTNMEYEKLGRGTRDLQVAGEYPWGTNTGASRVTDASNLINAGQENEGIAQTGANMVVAAMANSNSGPLGPVRVGIFGGAGTSREQSGAGFYGIMHLGDNLHDFCINLTNGSGRNFRDNMGNGVLTTAGLYDVGTWPGASSSGVSINGSCWMHGLTGATISYHAAVDEGSISNSTRESFYGGRGVRTAP